MLMLCRMLEENIDWLEIIYTMVAPRPGHLDCTISVVNFHLTFSLLPIIIGQIWGDAADHSQSVACLVSS